MCCNVEVGDKGDMDICLLYHNILHYVHSIDILYIVIQ